jgi:hypothetical protein
MVNKSKMTHQGKKINECRFFGEKNRDQKFIFTAKTMKMDCPFTNTID